VVTNVERELEKKINKVNAPLPDLSESLWENLKVGRNFKLSARFYRQCLVHNVGHGYLEILYYLYCKVRDQSKVITI